MSEWTLDTVHYDVIMTLSILCCLCRPSLSAGFN